eukprot:4488959-Amphidinium_carterae.1
MENPGGVTSSGAPKFESSLRPGQPTKPTGSRNTVGIFWGRKGPSGSRGDATHWRLFGENSSRHHSRYTTAPHGCSCAKGR